MDLYTASRRLSQSFPVVNGRRLPIHEHALIGDGYSCALVGTDGSIPWLCLPQFDSPSVFGAILDHERGGIFQVSPAEEGCNSRQAYDDSTNVLQTLFMKEGGAVVVTDFMEVVGGASCLESPSLADSLGWILTELDGLSVEPKEQSIRPTLAFADSNVTGFTGCNRLFGPATMDDRALHFGVLAVTRRACPDTVESTFLGLLETVDSYRIVGHQLELRSRGRLVAVLEHGAVRHTI